jgi:rhamnosyltransferase
MTKVSIVIPTKNAGPLFQKTLDGLKQQVYEDGIELIVIDSGSTDNTLQQASQYGAGIISIPPEEFNHGLTRNRAIENTSGEIIVMISQDAVPGDRYLIRNFVAAFHDPKVAGAYARQLPREDADLITKRNLNSWFTGRDTEEVRWIKDSQVYKAMSAMEKYHFCNFDNVCSAIRKSVWKSFPFNANDFGEDIDWAQRVLEAGWKIAYWPSSYVIHSHRRSIKYEYQRNRLCHSGLYQQFGISAVPSWKQLVVSTLASVRLDGKYILQNENQMGTRIKMLAEVPLVSFASVYGQFVGLKLGRARKKSRTTVTGA